MCKLLFGLDQKLIFNVSQKKIVSVRYYNDVHLDVRLFNSKILEAWGTMASQAVQFPDWNNLYTVLDRDCRSVFTKVKNGELNRVDELKHALLKWLAAMMVYTEQNPFFIGRTVSGPPVAKNFEEVLEAYVSNFKRLSAIGKRTEDCKEAVRTLYLSTVVNDDKVQFMTYYHYYGLRYYGLIAEASGGNTGDVFLQSEMKEKVASLKEELKNLSQKCTEAIEGIQRQQADMLAEVLEVQKAAISAIIAVQKQSGLSSSSEFSDIFETRSTHTSEWYKHFQKQLTFQGAQISELNSSIDRLEKKNFLLESSTSNGRMIFVLTNFLAKREDAKKGGAQYWDSAYFYTSPNGYKMRIRVFPNGVDDGVNSHVSLYIIPMQGHNDSALQWPLECDVKFFVLDHGRKEEHVSCSFDSRGLSSEFSRPQQESGNRVGFPRIMKGELFEPTSGSERKLLDAEGNLIVLCAVVPKGKSRVGLF